MKVAEAIWSCSGMSLCPSFNDICNLCGHVCVFQVKLEKAKSLCVLVLMLVCVCVCECERECKCE